MKKWIVMAMVVVLAGSASAQLMGLPVAEGAKAEGGALRVSGGAVIGDDANGYGGRVSYGLMEGLSLFGDLGLFDPDDGDSSLAWQVGGKFTLPLDLPVDLAIRAAVGMTSYDLEYGGEKIGDLDYTTVMGCALASKDIEQFTLYGFAGLAYHKAKVSTRWHGSSSDDDTEPAFGGGAIFSLTEQISLYGEVAHIDDMFFSLGGRFEF